MPASINLTTGLYQGTQTLVVSGDAPLEVDLGQGASWQPYTDPIALNSKRPYFIKARSTTDSISTAVARVQVVDGFTTFRGQTYGWNVMPDGKKWTVEEIRHTDEGVSWDGTNPSNTDLGRFYNLAEAQGWTLPDGLRIPTATDGSALIEAVGAGSGAKLRDPDLTYWNTDPAILASTNEYGFNIRGAGVRINGTYYQKKLEWMAWVIPAVSPSGDQLAINNTAAELGVTFSNNTAGAYKSVRLVADLAPIAVLTPAGIYDSVPILEISGGDAPIEVDLGQGAGWQAYTGPFGLDSRQPYLVSARYRGIQATATPVRKIQKVDGFTTIFGVQYPWNHVTESLQMILTNLTAAPGGLGKWGGDGPADDGDGRYFNTPEIGTIKAALQDGWRVPIHDEWLAIFAQSGTGVNRVATEDGGTDTMGYGLRLAGSMDMFIGIRSLGKRYSARYLYHEDYGLQSSQIRFTLNETSHGTSNFGSDDQQWIPMRLVRTSNRSANASYEAEASIQAAGPVQVRVTAIGDRGAIGSSAIQTLTMGQPPVAPPVTDSLYEVTSDIPATGPVQLRVTAIGERGSVGSSPAQSLTLGAPPALPPTTDATYSFDAPLEATGDVEVRVTALGERGSVGSSTSDVFFLGDPTILPDGNYRTELENMPVGDYVARLSLSGPGMLEQIPFTFQVASNTPPTPTPTETPMSQLDSIVQVTIDRQTQAVSQTSFGIPAVMGQFLTSKTTVPFTRAREYGDLTEFLADGWTLSNPLADPPVVGDTVADAVAAIFKQNPNVPKVIVGRKDAGDTDWTAALSVIANENNDWYLFTICPFVPATPNAEYLNAAAWTSTQKKLMFTQIEDTNTLSAVATSDLGYQLKGLNYDRVASLYHTAAKAMEQAQAGWLGEGAPYEPGSSTWAYKTIAGSTPDKLSTGQKSAAWAKNVNTYTLVAGVNITEKGKVASGEYIDIIIGVDWIESRLQETVFSALVNLRKLPYDEGGIQAVQGLVKSGLDEAARKGILQADSIEITVSKYSQIPQADRINRHLPDIKFKALLQGAIHTAAISGVVSV